MKYCIILLIYFLAAVLAPRVGAQINGTISGNLTDKSNNEVLIGANVTIVGTDRGAASDLDGHYEIKAVPPGTYRVRFNFISYQVVTIDNVVVFAGKDTPIDVAMSPSSIEMNEVVVTAEALKTSEFSVINIQKNASNIVDGVSSELITKNNSSDGTDVLKRMAGVTMSEGKYAYIRGVGDRYNSTLLNGSSLPSTDPEKKSFSYDMFPANLIENLLTSKTATPDKPADFSGGLIEINTIEFPSKMIFNFGVSTAYNSETNFQDFVRYQGGGTDWLGMDDGTRELPPLITDLKVSKGNYTPEELLAIGLGFKNNWNTTSHKAPIRGNLKLSFGNSHNFGASTWGYIAALNYANQDEITDVEKNFYTFDGPKYNYTGMEYSNSVAWSGMINTSLKLSSNHKISFKNLYDQTADNQTAVYEGPFYYYPDYRKITSLRYISRSLFSTQFIGEHFVGLLQGLRTNWNLNYSNSKRDEPDARRYIYDRDIDDPTADLRFLLDQSLSSRFYGNLDDHNSGASINFQLKLFRNPLLPNLKYGFHYDQKEREFDARTFGFWNVPGGNFMAENNLMTEPIEKIFVPENFGNKFIEVIEMTKAADSYTSDQKITSAYAMTDFNPLPNLKVITGVRFEKSTQNLNSFTITNEPVVIHHSYNDWLPSVNIAYSLNPTMIIRSAYAKTLARPEFREIAPFSYFDFLAHELVEGNVDLKRSLIDNFDLRYEMYPGSGEILAVSGFYKHFTDPIEQILIAASGFEPIRSYDNADKAVTYGIEFEMKKKLGFVSSFMKHFSFVGNISLIHSEITLADANGFQESNRPLQGQADCISNFGLYYEDLAGKFGSSLIYNKVGEKISKVGFANLGDIVELPRDQIDFAFSAKIIDQVTFKLSAKDLLNQDHKFIQRTPEGDKTAELRTTGRVISAGFNYQF